MITKERFYDSGVAEKFATMFSKRVKGRTGPSFVAPLEFHFNDPMSIEEVFAFFR